MKTGSVKNLALHFILIGIAALAARFTLLYAIGPQTMPDTAQYLEVSRNLAETGTFSLRDPATGGLAPFAMRVPLFHVFTAALIRLFGPDMYWQFVSLNILLSSAVVLMTAALFYSLGGAFAGLLAGYLMAFNPNSIYNSVLILPDTVFSFFVLLAALAGFAALRKGTLKRYLGWGAAIGLAALVKPVFKYFWAVPPLLLACDRELREKPFKKAAVFLLGFALVAAPWLARNYAQLGFAGFELTFGVNTIWSTLDLVKKSTPAQAAQDPGLAKVRDIVAASSEPMAAMADVKNRLNLTDVEVNSALARIGKEVMLGHPAEFARRYVKNAFNFITSPSSELELYYKASPGGEKNRQQIAEALAGGFWGTALVNIGARAAGLAVFLLGLYGLALLAGRDRPGALLLFSMIAYFALLSSFTAGYDRYRLPIDPLLAGSLALALGAEPVRRLFSRSQKGL